MISGNTIKEQGEKLKKRGEKLRKGVRAFARRRLSALEGEKMPTRDTTGKCEGECRDLVREGEAQRQAFIRTENVESPEHYPRASWARQRNNPPGELGGHV